MGIAQSGVFYYFPKQHLLFDSLATNIARANHELVSRLQETRRAETQLQKLFIHIEGNFLWAEKHSDQVGVLLLSVARTSNSRPTKKVIQQLFSVGEDRIYQYLVAAIAEKELVLKADIRSTAKFIHQSLMGMIVSFHYSRSRQITAKVYYKLLKEQLESLFQIG